MNIGVIGSGNIGSTAARLFVQAGHDVAIANSRGPESLQGLVADLGEHVRASTVEEATRFGNLVLVAIPFGRYRGLPADAFTDKIVVDANNYYPERDGRFPELDSDDTTSTELLAQHLQGARLVKSFNTMYFKTLDEEGRPSAAREERLALFVAGDDADAEKQVIDIIEQIGFAAGDTGSLSQGGRSQQPGSAVYNKPMSAEEGERAIASG